MTVEQREQVIDQPGVRLVAGDDGVEDVRVADPLHAPERLFLFEAVDHRLNGRERGLDLVGPGVVNFAHGTRAARPERLHDAELEPAQCRPSCHAETTIVADPTTYVVILSSASRVYPSRMRSR